MDTPSTTYAKTADGVHIAYQVIGEGPVDLVWVMGWTSNIEAIWEEPNLARFLSRLASFSRLILFDKRGMGMSDRVSDVQLPSLETRMDDVRAVMDAAGSERAIVYGVSEGGPMAMLFAATYPARTIALILYGTDADYTLRLSDNPAALRGTMRTSSTSTSTGERSSMPARRSGRGERRATLTTTGWRSGSPRTSGAPRAPAPRSRSRG